MANNTNYANPGVAETQSPQQSSGARFDDARIDEALRLLESVARDKKEELVSKIENKYDSIREIFVSETSSKLQDARAKLEETIKQGEQMARKAWSEVDRQVHSNPMRVIGGVAVSALLLGFILGTKRERNSIS